MFFVAAAVAMISLSSCKKDYECNCTVDGMTIPTISINDAKKDDAQTTCDQAETTYASGGASASCALSEK